MRHRSRVRLVIVCPVAANVDLLLSSIVSVSMVADVLGLERFTLGDIRRIPLVQDDTA